MTSSNLKYRTQTLEMLVRILDRGLGEHEARLERLTADFGNALGSLAARLGLQMELSEEGQITWVEAKPEQEEQGATEAKQDLES